MSGGWEEFATLFGSCQPLFAERKAPLFPQPKFYQPPDYVTPRPLYHATEANTDKYVAEQLQSVAFWNAATLTSKQLRQACAALAIPTRAFSEKSEFVDAINERRGTACAVCFADFESDEVLTVTNCGHLFHSECIRDAMVEKARRHVTPSCPTCRVRIDHVGAHKKQVRQQNADDERAMKKRKV